MLTKRKELKYGKVNIVFSQRNFKNHKQILTATDMYNEKIMLGLRTAGGIEADERLERAARRYLESGQMVKEKGRLRLTEDSLFISDYIISDLFEDQIID